MPFRSAALSLTACFAAASAPALGQDLASLEKIVAEARCASNADARFKDALRDIDRRIGHVARQPVTGAPVAESLRTPAFEFKTCASAAFPMKLNESDGSATTAIYFNRQRALIVPAGKFNDIAMVHEMFHAHQFRFGDMGILHSEPQLTRIDNAMADLLIEATAAAYVYIHYREKSFSDPASERAFRASGFTYGVAERFDAAYNTALDANKDQGQDARRSLALEAAGRAVARALIGGENDLWRKNYGGSAFALAFTRPSFLLGNEEGYAQNRDRIFRQIGAVSDGLNLTPPEFFGAEAAQTVEAALHKIHFPVEFLKPPDFLLAPPPPLTADVPPIELQLPALKIK